MSNIRDDQKLIIIIANIANRPIVIIVNYNPIATEMDRCNRMMNDRCR
jgi:hypothetical protein